MQSYVVAPSSSSTPPSFSRNATAVAYGYDEDDGSGVPRVNDDHGIDEDVDDRRLIAGQSRMFTANRLQPSENTAFVQYVRQQAHSSGYVDEQQQQLVDSFERSMQPPPPPPPASPSARSRASTVMSATKRRRGSIASNRDGSRPTKRSRRRADEERRRSRRKSGSASSVVDPFACQRSATQEALTRASLYHVCKRSPILSNIDYKHTPTTVLEDLVSRHNAQTIREVPILFAKYVVKLCLQFFVNRYSGLRAYVDPSNMRVRIEDDEMLCLMRGKQSGPPNLLLVVTKNMLFSVIGHAVSRLKDDLLDKARRGDDEAAVKASNANEDDETVSVPIVLDEEMRKPMYGLKVAEPPQRFDLAETGNKHMASTPASANVQEREDGKTNRGDSVGEHAAAVGQQTSSASSPRLPGSARSDLSSASKRRHDETPRSIGRERNNSTAEHYDNDDDVEAGEEDDDDDDALSVSTMQSLDGSVNDDYGYPTKMVLSAEALKREEEERARSLVATQAKRGAADYEEPRPRSESRGQRRRSSSVTSRGMSSVARSEATSSPPPMLRAAAKGNAEAQEGHRVSDMDEEMEVATVSSPVTVRDDERASRNVGDRLSKPTSRGSRYADGSVDDETPSNRMDYDFEEEEEAAASTATASNVVVAKRNDGYNGGVPLNQDRYYAESVVREDSDHDDATSVGPAEPSLLRTNFDYSSLLDDDLDEQLGLKKSSTYKARDSSPRVGHRDSSSASPSATAAKRSARGGGSAGRVAKRKRADVSSATTTTTTTTTTKRTRGRQQKYEDDAAGLAAPERSRTTKRRPGKREAANGEPTDERMNMFFGDLSDENEDYDYDRDHGRSGAGDIARLANDGLSMPGFASTGSSGSSVKRANGSQPRNNVSRSPSPALSAIALRRSLSPPPPPVTSVAEDGNVAERLAFDYDEVGGDYEDLDRRSVVESLGDDDETAATRPTKAEEERDARSASQVAVAAAESTSRRSRSPSIEAVYDRAAELKAPFGRKIASILANGVTPDVAGNGNVDADDDDHNYAAFGNRKKNKNASSSPPSSSSSKPSVIADVLLKPSEMQVDARRLDVDDFIALMDQKSQTKNATKTAAAAMR